MHLKSRFYENILILLDLELYIMVGSKNDLFFTKVSPKGKWMQLVNLFNQLKLLSYANYLLDFPSNE